MYRALGANWSKIKSFLLPVFDHEEIDCVAYDYCKKTQWQ